MCFEKIDHFNFSFDQGGPLENVAATQGELISGGPLENGFPLVFRDTMNSPNLKVSIASTPKTGPDLRAIFGFHA